MIGGTIEFAQARLQARHGSRAGAREWITLRAAITPNAVLEAARAGPLRHWISGVSAEATLDEMELALRGRMRDHIAEVASWMPAEWHAAVLWTRRLVDLPAFQRMAANRERPAWMKRDPALEGAPRVPDPSAVRDDWIRRWQRLWPADPEGCAAAREILAAFTGHLDRFARAKSAEAWALREAFEKRLEVLFRRHMLTAGAAFAHLALTALEIERLRAEIEQRMARRDLEAA